MSLNVCLLVLRLLFFEKFAGLPPMAKSISMVWGPHIARVKTKNILNLRTGLREKPLSYVELVVLRTDYLRGPFFVRPPPRLGGSRGASFGTAFLRYSAYHHRPLAQISLSSNKPRKSELCCQMFKGIHVRKRPIFRPKSTEEQKKVLTFADVQFSAQDQVKSKKISPTLSLRNTDLMISC